MAADIGVRGEVTAPPGSRGAARVALALAVAVAGLAGCDSDHRGGAESMCATANDYVWYVGYFVGDDGGPPAREELPDAVDTMADLADDLVGEVPADQRDGAQTAHRTWAGAQQVLDRYDLSDDSSADRAATELQAELGTYRGDNDRFVGWLRDACGFDGAEDLERPDGA